MSSRSTDFMDAPRVLDCTVTPIPAINALALQVVASTRYNFKKIKIADAIGKWVGIWVGPIGQEACVAVMGGGEVTEVEVFIPAKSRISLRSEDTNTITTGEMCLTFFV